MNEKKTAYKIAFSNKKGGCGKTTLTILTSLELQRLGYKVLVIDCDAQRNTTMFFGAEWEDKGTTVDMLLGDVPAKECIQHCKYGDIIPADMQLSGADNQVKRGPGENKHLLKAIKSVENQYDFIIFDTATALDVTLNNVLSVADYLIVPINGQLAIDGIVDFNAHVDDIIEFENGKLIKLGFVFNGYKSNVGISNLSVTDAEKIAKLTKTRLFKTKIRATAGCETAITLDRVPLYKSKKYRNNNTQTDVEKFVEEILKSIKNTSRGKSLVIKKLSTETKDSSKIKSSEKKTTSATKKKK